MMRHLSVDISTKMKVSDVVKALKENREKHVKLVAEAKEGYLKEAEKLLKQKLKIIRAGEVKSANINLTVPVDHTKEYDTVIGMLEATVEEQIELSASQYRMFIEDEWDWRDQFLMTNSAYSVGAAQAL